MTEVSGSTTDAPVLPIVRIAVLADGRIGDLALPAGLPLREIVPAVRRLLPASDDGADGRTDAAEGTPRQLTLAPIGGTPFSLEASLDTVGVVDGDLLALQPVPVGPAAPGIVEDVADAAVIFSAERLRPWGIARIRSIARAAGVVLLLAATALAAAQFIRTGQPAGLYASCALAVAAVVGGLLLHMRSNPASAPTGLSIAAFAPVATACAFVVPGEFGPPQVLLSAAGVTAWSILCTITARRRLAFFTAVSVVGAAVLAVAALAEFWSLPVTTLGCVLVVVALAITAASPQLSALWSRLPLPAIPAPGDPAPKPPAHDVLAELPHRIRLGESFQTGLLAGAVVLAVAGSLAVAGRPDASGWAWYAVAATSVAALLRARIWNGVACRTWLLAQPFLTSLGFVAVFAVQGRYLAALGALAVLALLTAGVTTVAANPKLAEPESYSLPVRRMVGLVASGVDASLIPVLAYLVGLFAWVLDR